MKLYELIISDELWDETGVFGVSIVKDPAIEQHAQFLDRDEPIKLRVQNEEERIVFGPILLADWPIYRNNKAFGEHYIQFSPATIKQIMQKYYRSGFQNQTNLDHNALLTNDNVTLYESFQVDKERGIFAPKGYDIPDGSWVGSFKVHDEDLWNEITQNGYTGFSVEGNFSYSPVSPEQFTDDVSDDELDELINEIEELIQKMENKNEE